MATAGMRVLVLAALAVGLLAAAVSGARDAMKVARGLVPEGGAAAGGVGAGQQRKGARILAAETFAHHAPLPDYLHHIPRRQALATTRSCSPCLSFHCSPWLSLLPLPHFSAPFTPHFSAPFTPHFSAPFTSFLCSLYPSFLCSLCPSFLCSPYLSFLFSPYLSFLCSPYLSFLCCPYLSVLCFLISRFSAFLTSLSLLCVTPIFSAHLTSHSAAPLDLANPARYPTQYQTGDIFVQTTPGYCEMRMNRGASGKLQMLPGETVNIVYAHTWDFRPCVQELRFGNGNSYSMTNTTECQLAKVI
ncbi:unnamed protein product [Closterium sp. Naga37s-1]|nr:unnamed protein product [Closterium sp. Naga37s-1]